MHVSEFVSTLFYVLFYFLFKVSAYLAHVEKRLLEENERLLHYLDYTTRKPLILSVEKLLIQDHVSSILTKG